MASEIRDLFLVRHARLVPCAPPRYPSRADSSTSLFRSLSPSSAQHSFLFSPLFFFDEVFVSSRAKSRGGLEMRHGAVKAAAIYWRHSSDRQRTASGDKIRAGALLHRSYRSDWKPKWIFPRAGYTGGGSHLVSEII